MTVTLKLWDDVETQRRNGKAHPAAAARPRLEELRSSSALPILGRYDAAQTSTEFSNYYAAADSYSSDRANSREVRHTLVKRSRYNVDNDAYADGITSTHCNYAIGCGPMLRFRTGDKQLDQFLAARWAEWAKVARLRQSLWTQLHAKIQDGEGFAILSYNPELPHAIKLDYCLRESEECQTPAAPYNQPGKIDGVEFDQWGRPTVYEFLRYHPGGDWSAENWLDDPDRYPARFVCHWFRRRRPGQHRGVPEFRSSLNTAASSRRHREAVVSAAESAARIALWLKTTMPPNEEADPVAPFSTVPLERNTVTASPMGWDLSQVEGKHPNAQYREFHRTQINEQGRPKSVPVNVAMGDSSEHSYASGKLDHLPWFAEIWTDRYDCEDDCLDKLLAEWWREARIVYADRIPPDMADVPRHRWDWDKLPVTDERAAAIARGLDLGNGSLTLTQLYADAGESFSDQIEEMAAEFGVDPQVIKNLILRKLYGVNAADQLFETELASAETGMDRNA